MVQMFSIMKNKNLRMFLILFLHQISICQGQNYKGFHFEDNLLEERFGPDNGYGVYQFDTPIPDFVNLIFINGDIQSSSCSFLPPR